MPNYTNIYIYQFKGYFNNKNIRIYKSGILHIYKVFLYISYLLVIGSEVIYNCPDPSKNSLRYRHCASNNLCFTFLEFYPSIQYSLLLLVLPLLFSTVIYSSRKFSSLGNFGLFSIQWYLMMCLPWHRFFVLSFHFYYAPSFVCIYIGCYSCF